MPAGLIVWLGPSHGGSGGSVITVCASGCTWSSVAQVNATARGPGDSVVFRGGPTFTGT